MFQTSHVLYDCVDFIHIAFFLFKAKRYKNIFNLKYEVRCFQYDRLIQMQI